MILCKSGQSRPGQGPRRRRRLTADALRADNTCVSESSTLSQRLVWIPEERSAQSPGRRLGGMLRELFAAYLKDIAFLVESKTRPRTRLREVQMLRVRRQYCLDAFGHGRHAQGGR